MGKGSQLVLPANRAKAIVRTHDGTCELITVIECCGARLKMLVPIAAFKRWYKEDVPGHFAYSPKGYSTSEIGLE